MPFWNRNPYRANAKLTVQQIHLRFSWERYLKTGRLLDLNFLIDETSHAVAVIPPDHPYYAATRAALGRAYVGRYWHADGGSVDDLDAGIEWISDALDVDGRHALYLPELHAELCLALIHRFEHRADRADLDAAVEEANTAMRMTDVHDEARGYRLHTAGNAYWMRAAHTSDLADLDRGIALQERAVKAGPSHHPQLHLWVSAVGVSRRNRYDLTGSPADLEASIERGEQAASMVTEGSRVLPLTGLSKAYRARFERTGALVDLEACIDRGEQALAALPVGSRGTDVLLSNLAIAHRLRFGRTGDQSDLDTAIELGERAVETTEHDHHNRAGRVANLAEAHLTRSGPGDLDAAIRLGERALAIQDDHTDRATHLSHLGSAYLQRFRHDRDPADLRTSVAHGEDAIATTQDASPNRALHLANLVATYEMLDDLPDPASLVAQAGKLSTSPPIWQVVALSSTASLLRGADSARLYRQAIAVLPTVAPRELERADQEHSLGRYGGLVGDAVAAQLAVDDVAAAVTVAEQGRGILLSAQLDTRTDVTRLAAEHPDLAAEFSRLRDALNIPPSQDADQHAKLAAASRRRQLSSDWEGLLTRVRTTAGFEDFLGAAAVFAPASGTVVIVNAARSRCDAILVHADRLEVVRLPDLTLADVQSNATRLLAATGSAGWAGLLARRRVVPEVLDWLWHSVARPVLAALDGSTSRIWWVSTGLLGLFPLHAAGEPGGQSIMDKVVSSHVPTIRTLRESTLRSRTHVRTQLAVSITRTLGHHDLPAAAAEAEVLRAHPGTVLLADESATVADVLAALPDATWAHFACHAEHDPTAPSRGGIVLSDGSVRVAQISALRPVGAELAYLSACSTAQGTESHADEAIHLVSAFQLAGYRHVVGTLWPVDDAVAARAARRFYALLPDGPTAERAAFALHEVTRELRAERPDRPDLWAPLIHSGP